MSAAAGHAAWLPALRRYLAVSAAAHLAWEFAHMPLYTLWRDGTARDIVFGALHCTAGDVLIALATLTAALVVTGEARWPAARFAPVRAVAVVLGLGYTALSEWLNVAVRGAWAYAEGMPVIPLGGFELGVTPLLQWLVIPWLAFRIARPAA